MKKAIHKNILFGIGAAILVALLFSACKPETIYLDAQHKPVRQKKNKLIGTWAWCGRSSFDEECECDTTNLGFKLIITEDDSIKVNIQNFKYEYNDNLIISYTPFSWQLVDLVTTVDPLFVYYFPNQYVRCFHYQLRNNDTELVLDANGELMTYFLWSRKSCFKKIE